MDDLTTRATEIVKQSRQCGRICIGAEDHCPCRVIAAAVVALVLDEAANVAEGFTANHHIAQDIKSGFFPSRSNPVDAVAAAIRALGDKT